MYWTFNSVVMSRTMYNSESTELNRVDRARSSCTNLFDGDRVAGQETGIRLTRCTTEELVKIVKANVCHFS